MSVEVRLQPAQGAQAQQAALDDWLAATVQHASRAVIVEAGFTPLQAPEQVPVLRLAPGCVCCVGNLPLQVTLTRVLRQQKPQALLLLVASDAHLGQLAELLRAPPFKLQVITPAEPRP